MGISGDAAIIGAAGDDGLGVAAGAAYLFDITTGNELLKLTASDAAPFDNFGNSVAISGTIAIVGAEEDDHERVDSGTADVFDTTTGNELFKLTASDAAFRDEFGTSVALSGATAIVGADFDDNPFNDSGSAYVFVLELVLDIDIDIKPGSERNPINLESKGVIPMAILGREDFDVDAIDVATLALEGAGPRVKGKSGNIGSFEDVNDDGFLDLILHFPTSDVDLAYDAVQAILTGRLVDGTSIQGSELIHLVGPGDANLDGTVSFADFSILQTKFGQAGTWLDGDFNDTGDVTFADFAIQQANFGMTVAPAAVPEPATLSLLALGSLTLLRRRRGA